MSRRGAGVPAVLALLLAASACRPGGRAAPGGDVVLRMLVPANERPFWLPLAASFAEANPGVSLDLQEGPVPTDLRESLTTNALLSGDGAYDLVYLDVTWTSKLAAAGWLLPLDAEIGEAERAAFLPQALAAGFFRGRLYRIPFRTDVGLLYYRADLLAEAGLAPPRSFAQLEAAARRLQSPPGRWGFLWQGAQYEGLVCFFLEVLHGHGGTWIDPETLEVGLESPEAEAALAFLVRARAPGGISPPGVAAYKEEETRHLFQGGRAIFLRNWPYVWRLSQREGSQVAGKVGVLPVPTVSGEPGSGTLGGWGLAVARASRHPREAIAFLRHATTLESQRLFCEPTGFAPARRDAYEDPALLAANPFLADLGAIHASATARPVVARYAQASDVLQRHLTAALAGLSSPREALAAAARETRLVLGEAP
ncbi:MAG: ABC transporter substrate-binding protein [Thermoanaerobaculia bacterium]